MKTIPEVQLAVAQRFHLQVHDLKGGSTVYAVARARMVGVYLCRLFCDASYHAIGQAFGGLNHSTIINACKRIERHTDPDIRTATAELMLALGGEVPQGWRAAGRPRKSRDRKAPKPPPAATIEQVLAATAEHFGIERALLEVRKPNDRVIHARNVAIFLAVELALARYAQIQVALGGQHRVGALRENASKVRWSTDPEVKAAVVAIRARLTEPPAADTPTPGL